MKYVLNRDLDLEKIQNNKCKKIVLKLIVNITTKTINESNFGRKNDKAHISIHLSILP